MAKYQLPPLKDHRQFEELICELLNCIENTKSYTNTDFQPFGVTGQLQKGIDIYSPKTRTVIQCKLKDVRKADGSIRKSLMDEIMDDLLKVEKLNFSFDRFILASTFRDDAQLQEFLSQLSQTKGYAFNVYYWGWDTISLQLENHERLLTKFFPNFRHPKSATRKPELPENALGKDLLRKNYVNYLITRFGDWKQLELKRKGEEFNWGSFKIHVYKKYGASGINHIHVQHFDNLVSYLQGRIDKTTFGRNQKSSGRRNYSTFEEHTKGIVE